MSKSILGIDVTRSGIHMSEELMERLGREIKEIDSKNNMFRRYANKEELNG